MNELTCHSSVQPARGRRYEPHPPEVYERAREMIAGGMTHREAAAQLRAEGVSVSARTLEKRVPVAGLRDARVLPWSQRKGLPARRYPGTLSAWHLGRLRATPGWAVHSRQWRLAKTLSRHVGHLVEFPTLTRLSGYARGSLAHRLCVWRKGGVLVDSLLHRGRRPGLLKIEAMRMADIEFPVREQMIRDVLVAMKRLGAPATPWRIAKTSGWSEKSVRRLLEAMDRERVVYEAVADDPRSKLYTLPGGWTFAPVGGES